MKILYHHRIASKDGQYVHVEEIIKAFRALGHEVIIVAPKIAENSDFGSDGGCVGKVGSGVTPYAKKLHLSELPRRYFLFKEL